MDHASRLLSAIVLGLGLATGAKGQDAPVSGKEITEQWVGKSAIGRTANGTPATLQLRADGTVTIASGSAVLDTGTWRAWDRGYCTTWKTIRAGQERCFTTIRSGRLMTVLNPDGSVSGFFDEIQ
jgi:hypothetical protein